MDYLLKSTLLSAGLYAFYKAFLERETFFQSNRLFFIIGIFIALFLPMLLIPIEVVVEAQEGTAIQDFIPLLNEADHVKMEGLTDLENQIDWMAILFSIYAIGLGVFALKFLSEIAVLAHLIYTNPKKRKKNYIQVETSTTISPFSFFIWIVFSKKQFTSAELKHIINHEKVHVNQGHSFDMLFIQFLTIIQWFNPFVWLFKKELQQNLEFIADKKVKETTQKESSLKDYQYLLLKTGIGKDPFATTNNFFNSHLKKRIIMLQKNKTNYFNQIKYALVLPLLALFMYSFSTKKVLIVKHTHAVREVTNKQNQKNSSIQFIMPLENSKLRIASGYGMRFYPILKTKAMHKGIDFTAPKGTAVYAAANGVVIEAKITKTLGKIIRIKHTAGYQTNYYHLSEFLVKKGDTIQLGTLIAKVGSTGESTAPHLHFEVLKNGEHINPLLVLPKTTDPNYKRLNSSGKTAINQVRKEKTHNKTITKNTSQKELDEIQDYYQKLGVELIFTNSKRNQKREIISLSLQAKTKHSKTNFSAVFTHPIDPITIEYKDDSVSFYSNTTQTKKSALQVSNASQFQSKTLAISNNNNIINKDSIRPVGIIKSDSLTGTKTMYIITEQINAGGHAKSLHIQTSSITDNFEISNLTNEVTININDETGKTSFTRNGKTYSEEEVKRLKEIGREGSEMIEYNKLQDRKVLKKKREKYLDKRKERIIKSKEKSLKIQEKKLKKQEKRLKKQEKYLRKREEALRKRLVKQNSREKETGYMQYKGENYYYAGDAFYNKFGEVVSKKQSQALLDKRNEIREESIDKAKQNPKETGYIQYKGENYYYNGDTFYNKFGEVVSKKQSQVLLDKRNEIGEKSIDKAKQNPKETGYIQYKGENYYYAGDAFYNKFGEVVSKKLARKLKMLRA